MSGREPPPGVARRPEPEEIPPESTEFPLETVGSSHDAPQAIRTKRRRRQHTSESHHAKSQSFYFVDSNSSSKEKRAHVMRHHVQEKRKQRKESTGSIPGDQMQEHTSWQARKDSGYDTDNRRESVAAGADQESSLPIRFSAMPPHSPSLPTQSGAPIPGSSTRKNSCSSHVMAYYHPEDQALVGYWYKTAYWSGENSYLKAQIFQIASEHLITFQAVVMTYCARFKAHLDGQPDSEPAQRHTAQARQYIHDATAGHAPLQDDRLAMALTGMALHEHRFGNKEEAYGYLDHAFRIMRPRTGCNPQHSHRACRAAVAPLFLCGAEEIMRAHNSADYLAAAPLRQTAFTMESPLFPLLSSGPRPSEVPLASRKFILPHSDTQEVSRTAALIYITAALWDFKDCASKAARFLAHLTAVVEQHQLHRHLVCETLVWLLLEQGGDADLRNPERAWWTGELLRTHKQLRPDLQFLFNEILMSFLTLKAPIRGIEVFQHELRTYTGAFGR
ncbi:hypothetical protein N7470_008623 [Penicillium chermesinum]|nr:hypothetical protein N7470_008623 [Penicillium chermesinum]